MKVLKFGGTSLKTPERIKSVVKIIADAHPCTVVVSAFGGVTDVLISLIETAFSGKEIEQELHSLFIHHYKIINDLHINKIKHQLDQSIGSIENEIKNILHQVAHDKDNFLKYKDAVISTGELLSAQIITAVCVDSGIDAEFIDTRKVIITDDHFGNAFVHYQESYNQIRKVCSNPSATKIVTGFIGSTAQGVTTTFGRSGSDYTAAIFGAALSVEEIEIWTDVNGILRVDPHVVSDAKTISHLTYEEAMELAHAGAKVIFPPTMIPALYKSIPIRVRNTFEPDNPGTIITKNRPKDDNIIAGISSLYSISMIRFQGAGMVGRFGVIGRIFNSLAVKKINIILVSQVFSEHSICFAIKPEEVESAVAILNQEFMFELQNKYIDSIKIENNLSLIALVGEGMRHTPGVSGKIFGVLGKSKINVIAIAQGSSERNISIIVSDKDVHSSIKILHEYFFETSPQLNLFIAGVGLVGSSLLNMLMAHPELRICGLINSKNMVLNPNGISPNQSKEELQNGITANLNDFIPVAIHTPNSVFVDVTSSPDIAHKTIELLAAGMNVVTASKQANSLQQKDYDQIRENCRKSGTKFLYEANVGAGLPIIAPLQSMIKTGDNIERIEGVMSGTISYLLNEFDGTVPFSKMIRIAREKGFTEPDPRDDLNGTDVARKLLILARETAAKLNLSDLEVESLIPDGLSSTLTTEEFLVEISRFDSHYDELYKHAQKSGKVLRYIAIWDGKKATVGLQEVGEESPFYNQKGRENFIIITSGRYHDVPMIIRGHGAGAEVTAAAVLGNILECKQ